LAIDVRLDRRDSRRRQFEDDALAKVLLARPDTAVRAPFDTEAPGAGEDARYGVIVVRVGNVTRETRSIAPREIVGALFEAASRPPPAWLSSPYAGHPAVIEGTARTALALCAYLILPGALLAVGIVLAQRRKSR
jgi:hypothetical protein